MYVPVLAPIPVPRGLQQYVVVHIWLRAQAIFFLWI